MTLLRSSSQRSIKINKNTQKESALTLDSHGASASTRLICFEWLTSCVADLNCGSVSASEFLKTSTETSLLLSREKYHWRYTGELTTPRSAGAWHERHHYHFDGSRRYGFNGGWTPSPPTCTGSCISWWNIHGSKANLKSRSIKRRVVTDSHQWKTKCVLANLDAFIYETMRYTSFVPVTIRHSTTSTRPSGIFMYCLRQVYLQHL